MTGLLLRQPTLAAAVVLSGLMLAAYFRLRRRGLMERDRTVRLLPPLLLLQAAALALGEEPLAALLALPALAVVLEASRPLLPAELHGRLWTRLLLALAAAQALSLAIM